MAEKKPARKKKAKRSSKEDDYPTPEQFRESLKLTTRQLYEGKALEFRPKKQGG